MEHFLGGLAFAKALNRTLVLPPFRTYVSQFTLFLLLISQLIFFFQKNVPFDDWFKVEPLAAYHRIISAHDFMDHVAPILWPPDRRYGFCYVLPNSDQTCEIKIGNPFTNFWDELNVDFSSIVPYSISYHEPEEWRRQ